MMGECRAVWCGTVSAVAAAVTERACMSEFGVSKQACRAPTLLLRPPPIACPPLARPPPPEGTLFVERGTIVTVFIICYALTSFVGG